ncbi:MAG: sigma-70 family RNA polymerase sigma factor [Saprospiraceae bacterium]
MENSIKFKDRSDNTLLSQYKDGEEVMGELFSRYKNLVFGSCLKYLKNRADAEDAVSDIFILISKKLKTHQVQNFKSWLYTVTRNHCIEQLRKKNRYRDKISAVENMYSASIFHPDNIDDEEIMKKLEKCIEALPQEQKQTVDLFYYKKISYKLIAEQMNITWDKVRSFMQNGRRNIKNCLEIKNLS